ncbi:MAG: metallophosphoesterase family protein [Betaproteobacteria bacterium]
MRDAAAPGRTCPASYGYSPTAFARPPELGTSVLYAVGGLYGNLPALRETERMAALESEPTRIVFNGDYHWFDADPADFLEIERGVMRHTALRGNVETEIASEDDANGCGCAYPESVPDDDVERSNRILARLRAAARAAESRSPGLVQRLAGLPMHLVANVGGARVAVVHGDAWALAGWRFAHDSLHSAAAADRLHALFEQAAVDGFASSHTCLPALKFFDTALGERFIVNNGAAGMPNFRGTRSGVLTRIAAVPVPAALHAARLYGGEFGGIHVDALAVRFDAQAWCAGFARLWPAGSDAALSYGGRIVDGPDFSIDDALGRSTPSGCPALAA